ncbi:hypothetical protein SUDANB121_05281 [Nocardiopsis dassonvillei]|uniref:protein-tyrosine phosphatase family protein n=1 Tax=Nocardiopsis dassonvillei TaxID=2014 RepID=UPI003F57311A
MTTTWHPDAAGVLRLPSGRLVRGRPLALPLPEGPMPDLGVYLLGRAPAPVPWESRWVRWPDFRLPADPAALAGELAGALERAADERVEFACLGGRGRTGTALSCLAVLDGVPPGEAVAYVREYYSPHAVETRRQERFVADFAP